MAVHDITLDLWRIASERAKLTIEEIEEFSDATGQGYFANNLAVVVDGIGCLVSSDNNANPGTRSGSFQGQDTSNLLFSIGECLRLIAAREQVASEAAYQLAKRYKEINHA